MRASVEVDARTVESEIDERVYGHFIENMARCIYGGLLRNERPGDPRGPWRLNEEVVRMAKALRPSVLRWPGGNYAEGYHWRDGIGPVAARPLNRNRYWSHFGPPTRVLDPHAFGTDEFLALVETLEAEPYVNVNVGTGSPDEAAHWVEYMNGPSDTIGGSLRASYGREQPYGVRLWGIGNEMYGPWTLGHRGPREYAARYLEYRGAMGAVDGNLRCVAVGAEPFYGEAWNREVLEVAGDRIDMLSIHIYLPSLETAPLVAVQRRLGGPAGMYGAIVASPIECERKLACAARDIETVMGAGSGIGVALDEWNLWWKPSQVLVPRWTLRDALFACGMFHVFHRNSSYLKMANASMLINVMGLIRVSGPRVFRTAMYYPFLMYARLAGSRSVVARVACGTFDSRRLGRIPPIDGVPIIDCSATLSSDGSEIVVFVLNRHMTEDIDVDLELLGFEPVGEVEVHCLNGPDALSENSIEDDEVVSVRENRVDTGDILPRYKFPAHSATAFVFKRSSGQAAMGSTT
jgi:alpha-N-arabinofuranosidase